MSLRVASVVLSIVLAALGCDGRAREIRSGLSQGDQQRFDRGKRLSTPCWSCHDFYGTQNKVGPYLSGLYGRPAASARFGGYSSALRGSGIVWDDRSLAAFLRSPQQTVPGTTMLSPGLESAGDVSDLVLYIRLVTATPSG